MLSNRSKVLYNYFKQLFAQVTNPPIDPIREEIVMSLTSFIGSKPNLLGVDETKPAPRLEVHQPVLSHEDAAKLHSIEKLTKGKYKSKVLDLTYPVKNGAAGCEAAIKALCKEADKAVAAGFNVLILSDRALSEKRVAIPALLATSAVHHHLVKAGSRTSTGLVVETGSAREVHHFALLAGYGAEAVYPWLAYDSLAVTGATRGLVGEGCAEALRQGDQQGPAQGDVQDGHFHLSVLLRLANLRSDRPQQRFHRQIFPRNRNADSGYRPARKWRKKPCAYICRRSATIRCW